MSSMMNRISNLSTTSFETGIDRTVSESHSNSWDNLTTAHYLSAGVTSLGLSTVASASGTQLPFGKEYS